MIYLKVTALVFGMSFVTQLFAADQTTDPVSALVRTEMQNQHIPGLTLLVSKNGKPIRTEGYGVSNLELNVPAKPETIFQSGSVGKQFTATAVMMLVEAGQVGLEDPQKRTTRKRTFSRSSKQYRSLIRPVRAGATAIWAI